MESGLNTMNHSCWPNAKPITRKGRIVFVALRFIAPGEEITPQQLQDRNAGILPAKSKLPLPRCLTGVTVTTAAKRSGASEGGEVSGVVGVVTAKIAVVIVVG